MLNIYTCCVILALLVAANGFTIPHNSLVRSRSALNMADVEIVFPNKKKVKAAAGSPLKDAAKKAGYKPNYGCEEGKCGSCELKVDGSKKIRPCIGKVPKTSVTLTEP